MIKACRSKSKRHNFQTLVPKLVQFTTILLIFGTMNNIFSTLLRVTQLFSKLTQLGADFCLLEIIQFSIYNFVIDRQLNGTI